MNPSAALQVRERGFAILPNFLDDEELAAAEQGLAALGGSQAARTKGGVYAARDLLSSMPGVQALATLKKIREITKAILGGEPFPVRGLLFDKTPAANWLVPWHQDLTICVKARREAAGFGPWSRKAGLVHVQAPADVLDQMLAVRLHLDDCGRDNGALRVIPGTHRAGRLSADRIATIRASADAVDCAVSRGGALLMKPLLVHASSVAKRPVHRRVIHLEFASCALPCGLEWQVG